MNYRHLYHAGNFADVFKHCILILLFQSLAKKAKPITYLDTHAGIGLYDLTSEIALKTREYENGISRIYNLQNCPIVVQDYLNIVKSFNTQELRFYPGSPLIVSALMRPQDSMILIELHDEDIKLLRNQFYGRKNIAIHHADGYQSIKAFLPPKTGRGLILIDPPFEEKNEFEKIIQALEVAYERFPIGIYAIWYPIKEQLLVQRFHADLQKLRFKNYLIAEFSINEIITETGLTSCGMVIINPPWQFEEQLHSLDFCHHALDITLKSLKEGTN